MNALKCRTLTELHAECRQWTLCQLSSDLFRTGEFFDKASQIAEETLVMTIDKVKKAKF